MLNNMGLSQQQLMMQRRNMYRNYQMGAFLSDTSGEHLEGTRVANPYLRYYAQMQRDAMEHQRRVMLQQQMMQRQMAVQQHQFMLDQQHEENKIQRSEKERQDKLLEVRTRREKIQNDDRFSAAQKAHYDKQAALEEAELDDAPKLFTYTQEESGYFYPENYPVKEKRGKPILNTIQLDNQTGQKTITGVPGKELYQDYQAQLKDDRSHNLEREKEDRAKAEAFAKALTTSPAEKKAAEDKRIAELPIRKTQRGNNATSRPLPDAAQKSWHDDARSQAKQLYVDQQKAKDPNYQKAVDAEKKDMQSQLEAQYNADFEQNSGDETHPAGKFLKQKTDTLWNERHTAAPQDTGEMFAAQDPGMGQDMFNDPGMDFDPVDETYTLDEIA